MGTNQYLANRSFKHPERLWGVQIITDNNNNVDCFHSKCCCSVSAAPEAITGSLQGLQVRDLGFHQVQREMSSGEKWRSFGKPPSSGTWTRVGLLRL